MPILWKHCAGYSGESHRPGSLVKLPEMGKRSSGENALLIVNLTELKSPLT